MNATIYLLAQSERLSVTNINEYDMWHLVTYHMSKGLFSHIVEDSCLEEHNKYIKEKYDAEPEWTKEVDQINLDPGGMMRTNGSQTVIDTEDECKFVVNDEHIIPAIEYYFSIDLLINASERRIDGEDDSGYTVRIIKDDIIKVYQPFMILVMRADMYMDIAGSIEKLYLKGLNSYLELVSTLPDEYFESILLNSFGDYEMAEA